MSGSVELVMVPESPHADESCSSLRGSHPSPSQAADSSTRPIWLCWDRRRPSPTAPRPSAGQCPLWPHIAACTSAACMSSAGVVLLGAAGVAVRGSPAAARAATPLSRASLEWAVRRAAAVPCTISCRWRALPGRALTLSSLPVSAVSRRRMPTPSPSCSASSWPHRAQRRGERGASERAANRRRRASTSTTVGDMISLRVSSTCSGTMEPRVMLMVMVSWYSPDSSNTLCTSATRTISTTRCSTGAGCLVFESSAQGSYAALMLNASTCFSLTTDSKRVLLVLSSCAYARASASTVLLGAVTL